MTWDIGAWKYALQFTRRRDFAAFVSSMAVRAMHAHRLACAHPREAHLPMQNHIAADRIAHTLVRLAVLPLPLLSRYHSRIAIMLC